MCMESPFSGRETILRTFPVPKHSQEISEGTPGGTSHGTLGRAPEEILEGISEVIRKGIPEDII